MCGIFGVIHNKKMKLNKSHFNALGVINDTRGGDSCGIALDTNLEYGIDKEKLYSNFFHTSKVLKEVNYCDFAFGHCRKASVGGISLETAQPVAIKEGDDIKFILIHNGTIYNYKELAAKYIPERDIIDLTDSQVMALIFYYAGYAVLTEYIGAGAFVMADYRTETGSPIVRMFKGFSKLTTHSKDASEERPLFITKEANTIWFSSIFPMLAALRVGTDVYTATPNMLYTIEKARISKREMFDRSEQTQAMPKTTYGVFGGYSDEDYYNNRYQSGISRVSAVASSDSWIINPYYISNKVQYFKDGLFHTSNAITHGLLNITSLGNIVNAAYSYSECNLVPIFQGVLLVSIEAYQLLEAICVEYELNPVDLMSICPDVVWKYSYFPRVSESATEIKFTQHLLAGEFNYTGNLAIMFTYYPTTYCIRAGKITRRSMADGSHEHEMLFSTYCECLNNFVFNYKKEYKRITKKIDKLCQEFQKNK